MKPTTVSEEPLAKLGLLIGQPQESSRLCADKSHVICDESEYLENLVAAVEANPIAWNEDKCLTLGEIFQDTAGAPLISVSSTEWDLASISQAS